jgi:hypothetical protein
LIDDAWARRELEHRETEELLDILVARDEDEWRPEVFPLVETVLRERGVDPEQAVAERRRRPPAPRPLEIAEPETAGPIVLLELEDEVEARLCRMALLESGIEAVLRKPDGSGVLQLVVDESKAEAARAVLEAAETDPDAEAGFRCASCGFIAEPVLDGDRRVCQVCGEAG